MADDMVTVQLRLKDARRFMADAKLAAGGVDTLSDSTARADKRTRVAAVGTRMLTSSLRLLRVAAIAGGTALATVATGGALYAVNAASDLTEQVNKSTVVFRGHEKGVLKWSTGLVDAFGISQRQALESAGVFGNMLVPMGFARKEAAGMSKGLVQLAGDMSSFNNADPSEVLEAMRAGLSGETEPLRKFGVFLNDARIQAEAMRLGLKKVDGQLPASAKAQAAYSLIVKDTADAHGDFARSAGTSLANQLRILKAGTENVAAAMGQKLLPFALRVVTTVQTMVATFGRARNSGASFGFAIATALDAAAGGGNRFRSAFLVVREVGMRVWAMGKDLVLGLRDLVAAFIPAGASAEGAGSKLRGVGDALKWGTSQVRSFGAWMRKGGKGASTLKGAVVGLTAAFVAYRVVLLTIAAYHAIVSAGLTVAIAALYAWSFAVKAVTVVNRLFTIGMLALNLAMLANPVVAIVAGVLLLVGAFVLAYRKIEWFRNGVNAVLGFVREHWPTILAILTGPIGLAVLLIVKKRDAIMDALRGLVGFVKKLPGMLAGAARGLWSWLTDGLSAALGGATDFALGIGKKLANAIIGGLNDMLPNKISIPGAPDVNLPNNPIPMLANGGTLYRGGSVLVGERGPEFLDLPRGARVRPLERAGEVVPFGAGGGSGSSAILRVEVVSTIDGREVARSTADVTADELARR